MNFKTKFKENFGKLIIVACFACFALLLHFVYLMRNKQNDSFRIMCIVIGIILFCLVFVEFYLAYFREWPIHRLYFVAALVIGIVFMFVIPPYATPDERTHTSSSIHVSNVIMGYGEPDDGTNNLYMRNTEHNAQINEYVKRNDYKIFLDDISLTTTEDEREMVAINIPYPGPAILYLIPGIGITIGRLLHFGGTATILLATLCNVLFFVISTTFAIKIIPFEKDVLMVISMFPMVLQLTSSLSYDNAVLSSFFVVIAIGLKWSYAKQLPVTRKEIIVYLVYGAITCLVKGGVYAMFLLLPVICNSSKTTIKNIWSKYKYWIIAGVILFLAVLGRNAIFSIVRSLFVTNSVDISQTVQENYSIWDNNYIQWAECEGYSLKQFLLNPPLLIVILLNTLVSNLSYYTSGMIASPLGWLNIEIPWFYIVSYVVVLFIASIKVENAPVYLKKRDRILVILFGLISIGLSSAALLMYWTPTTYSYIAGIQGRYFIPPFIMMILMIRNDLITTKKKMTRGILMSILILTMISVFYILRAATV